MTARPLYTYVAPSGVLVTSVKPLREDRWARGNLEYGVRSYVHILKTVLWKETRRARRLRRERGMQLEDEYLGRREFDLWRHAQRRLVPYDWADFSKSEKEKWIARGQERVAREAETEAAG